MRELFNKLINSYFDATGAYKGFESPCGISRKGGNQRIMTALLQGKRSVGEISYWGGSPVAQQEAVEKFVRQLADELVPSTHRWACGWHLELPVLAAIASIKANGHLLSPRSIKDVYGISFPRAEFVAHVCYE